MPTLLVKIGRVPRAPALGTRPVFLPLKPAPPISGVAGLSGSRRAGITHYTLQARCVPNGASAPFGNPGEAAAPRVKWVAPAPHFRFGLPPALPPCTALGQRGTTRVGTGNVSGWATKKPRPIIRRSDFVLVARSEICVSFSTLPSSLRISAQMCRVTVSR